MTPNTTVTLYATPFDISNKYVIAADSPGEALAIVSSYPSKVYTDCYWQRDNDFVFRANGNINEVEQYNYCVYLNNGRYNFAFITECDYVNDAMTLVHLATDPWLNFAGQYTFNPSPMVRCHPPQDNQPTSIKYADPEPIDVDEWTTTIQKYGDSPTIAPEKGLPITLVTALSGTKYVNMLSSSYWDNLYNFINGNNAGGYASMISTYANSDPTVINGTTLQLPTSVGNLDTIKQLITNIIKVGREQDIIGAYYVPDSMYSGLPSTGIASLATYNGISEQIVIDLSTTGILNPVRWSKISFLPQYKRIYANVAGNVYEYDVRQFYPQKLFPGGGNSVFNVESDVSINGCIKLIVKQDGILRGADKYVVCSNVWDRIQLSVFGVNQFTLQRNLMNARRTLLSGAMTVLGNAIDTNPRGMVESFADLYYATEENKLSTKESTISGGYTLQSADNSMADYNRHYPLVIVGVDKPTENEIEKLNSYFGTYGYTMNGKVCPLDSFKAPVLPYWYYYHSMNASIEGRNVPQRYLLRVIDMFNRGVFVFRDTASYKNFGLAKDNHF
jgi:hypothetical protein